MPDCEIKKEDQEYHDIELLLNIEDEKRRLH